jgi:ABC-type Fe3+-hydroxamate transport system substrate-binding protein/AraC-like DNA-binding protein
VDIYEHRDARDELDVFRNHVRFQNVLMFLFQQNRSYNMPDKEDNDWHQAVELSIQHISEHYNTSLTVDELAAIANIDRWKYTRLFKKVTGQVPLQYLNDIRIDKTKTLLRMTEDRLYDIAQHVGFNNEYYLNRRFKQQVGISPGQYRRNHREPMRVIAPFMEDFLVALDIMPVAQYSHSRWGRQHYLGLDHIPTFDELNESMESLSAHKPDIIMLMDRYDQRLYTQCKQISSTCIIRGVSDDWRSVLRLVADWFGRSDRAEKVISAYEDKAKKARLALQRIAKQQTVAFLRISADHIHMYAHSDQGFTGPVLHKDLGLLASPLSRGEACTSRMVKLSMEELSRLHADHLFITFDKWHSQEQGAERRLLFDSVWQSLPAVRNKRVYEVDFLTWMNNGVISNSKKIEKVLQVLA